jgi:hypothetical protein
VPVLLLVWLAARQAAQAAQTAQATPVH